MSRLPRPYIPVSVRVQVAERQLIERGMFTFVGPASMRLRFSLKSLFNDKKAELHHRPALVNRRLKRNGDYDPPANDPAYLVYLADDDHDIETRVRGLHGQHSDFGLRRKNRRMDENRGRRKRRPKKKIPSRPFPKKSLGGFPGGRLADRASSAEPTVAAARGWPTQD